MLFLFALLILFSSGLYLSLKKNSRRWEFFVGISLITLSFLGIIYTITYMFNELGLSFFAWLFLFIFGIWAFFFSKHWR